MEVFRRWLRRWEGANGSLVITIEESVRNRARRRAKVRRSCGDCRWNGEEEEVVTCKHPSARHWNCIYERLTESKGNCGRPLVEVKE
jgi:hypothetical protein